jgi:hypothetical protein
MQIYAALRERNALGLKMHAMSAETGDAAELLAGLFPDGELSGGYNNLSELAGEMADAKEGRRSLRLTRWSSPQRRSGHDSPAAAIW